MNHFALFTDMPIEHYHVFFLIKFSYQNNLKYTYFNLRPNNMQIATTIKNLAQDIVYKRLDFKNSQNCDSDI